MVGTVPKCHCLIEFNRVQAHVATHAWIVRNNGTAAHVVIANPSGTRRPCKGPQDLDKVVVDCLAMICICMRPQAKLRKTSRTCFSRSRRMWA